jgi:RNA polymerase sigma-70 factor (ECF subfamily)
MPFSSWLYRIAHNQVVDHLRKKARQATVPIDEMVASDEDPREAVEVKLQIEELAQAAKKLTAAQREVISLRFAAELSVAEVARAMGKSEGAIKALQHSAIAALRRVLAAGQLS